MKYVFGININNTGEDGIIDIDEKECICICTKEKSKLIISALELYLKESSIKKQV